MSDDTSDHDDNFVGPVQLDSTRIPADVFAGMQACVRDNPEPPATAGRELRLKYAAAKSAIEDDRKRREIEEAAKTAVPIIPAESWGQWHPVHGWAGWDESGDVATYPNREAALAGIDDSMMEPTQWRPVLVGVDPKWRDAIDAIERRLSHLMGLVARRPPRRDIFAFERTFRGGADCEVEGGSTEGESITSIGNYASESR